MATATFRDGESVYRDDHRPATTARISTAPAAIPADSPFSGNDISDETVVDIGGVQTTVGAAVQAGLIRREGAGYVPAEQGQEPTESEPEAAPAETPEAFDDETEATIGTLASNAPPSAIAAAVDSISRGEAVPDRYIGETASLMGIEPAEAARMVEVVQDAYVAQAHARIASHGLDPEAVFDWAVANAAGPLREAIQAHTTTRTVSKYDALASAYLEGLDQIDPAYVMASNFGNGITARQERDGTVVLNIPGRGEMAWRSAIATGAITIGKKGATR